MLNFLINKYGEDKLNTMTKYPSILTYHKMDGKGVLTEELSENKVFDENDKVYITEKIDGTNIRIICSSNNDYIIGTRNEFLYAKGDRIINHKREIVDSILSSVYLPAITDFTLGRPVCIIYGEVYGGRITAKSKEYTIDKSLGFRVFDVARYTLDEMEEILTQSIKQILSWREHGNHNFLDVTSLKTFCINRGLPLVPYLSDGNNGIEIPKDLDSSFKWLQNFKNTSAGINAHGKAEGIVIRNNDRSMIRKLRFEDYEKCKRKGGF